MIKPDFLIIGEMRSGTSSLWTYLKKHPNVTVSEVNKEIEYFSINFWRGPIWYSRHFIPKKNSIIGEASPYYMFHPHAAKRISQFAPKVKLIALLRNPVERAYSLYYLRVRQGLEPLSFEEAIHAEHYRLSQDFELLLSYPYYKSFNHNVYSYLTRGLYVNQLRVWFNLFPKEQILVVKSEDLFKQSQKTLRSILEFLNLPITEAISFEKVQGFAKYPEIDPITRAELQDYYNPYNAKLSEFLGVDFDWW